MWKRELFFFFERLEIRAGERRAIASFLLLGTLLNLAADWMPSPSTYDAAFYQPLMAGFNERLARQHAEAAAQDSLYLGLVKESPLTILSTNQADTSRPAHRAPNSKPIPINTATAKQLEALPGIGPALAARIVQHRNENGPFKSVDDLTKVRGIGPVLLAKIRPFVVCC